MGYPTNYASSAELFNIVENQRGYTLRTAITDLDATIPIIGNLDGVSVPVFIRFDDGGELFKADGVEEDPGSPGSWRFISVTRGVSGTVAQAQIVGDTMYMPFVADHFNSMITEILAGQKFAALVGLDAAKPGSPVVGNSFIATDTGLMYVCFVNGSWEIAGGLTNHAELFNRDQDDHTQYHDDSRASTWHTALSGDHVEDGDSHDHSEGLGIARIQAGLESSRPGTPATGLADEIYLDTDTGILQISPDGSGWTAIVGAPAGLIAAFLEATITDEYSGACPPGWVRYTEADGRFLRGAATGVTTPLNQAGSDTHTHEYIEVPEHTHDVPSASASGVGVGNHSHSFAVYAGSGNALFNFFYNVASTLGTSSSGSHSHSATISGGTSAAGLKVSDNAAGAASRTSSDDDHEPPYQEVIFCVKS